MEQSPFDIIDVVNFTPTNNVQKVFNVMRGIPDMQGITFYANPFAARNYDSNYVRISMGLSQPGFISRLLGAKPKKVWTVWKGGPDPTKPVRISASEAHAIVHSMLCGNMVCRAKRVLDTNHWAVYILGEEK